MLTSWQLGFIWTLYHTIMEILALIDRSMLILFCNSHPTRISWHFKVSFWKIARNSLLSTLQYNLSYHSTVVTGNKRRDFFLFPEGFYVIMPWGFLLFILNTSRYHLFIIHANAYFTTAHNLHHNKIPTYSQIVQIGII